MTLTFAAIEALLRTPLPLGARLATFWSNAPARGARVPGQARAWRAAGWWVARRDLWGPGSPAVTFARADGDAPPPWRPGPRARGQTRRWRPAGGELRSPNPSPRTAHRPPTAPRSAAGAVIE